MSIRLIKIWRIGFQQVLQETKLKGTLTERP